MKTIDFYAKNEGSIILLYPESDNAKQFCEFNIQLDNWQNKNMIAIEPRYFDDIYMAIQNEGMTIKPC
jgi:hypothetical protein